MPNPAGLACVILFTGFYRGSLYKCNLSIWWKKPSSYSKYKCNNNVFLPRFSSFFGGASLSLWLLGVRSGVLVFDMTGEVTRFGFAFLSKISDLSLILVSIHGYHYNSYTKSLPCTSWNGIASDRQSRIKSCTLTKNAISVWVDSDSLTLIAEAV